MTCGVASARLQSHIKRGETMTRTATAGLALITALYAQAAFGQAQDFSKVEMKVTPVAGNIYLLQGAGGNIAAVVGADGIVIVDDEYAPLADKVREALRGISREPVRYVINTHFHFDHAGGNVAFAKEATLVAQDNVRKRLSQDVVSGTGGAVKLPHPAQPPEGLPIITFGHDLTIHLNGEDIRALHAPHGHTDGDAIIFFPKANVVHTGDLFVRYGFPFIDIATGGSSQGIIDGLEAMAKTLPADVKVIPGHGAVSNLTDVAKYVTMLRDTRAVVAKGVKAGKTVQQLKAEKVLAPWQTWTGPFIGADDFIDTLYNEVTGAPGGKVRRHN